VPGSARIARCRKRGRRDASVRLHQPRGPARSAPLCAPAHMEIPVL